MVYSVGSVARCPIGGLGSLSLFVNWSEGLCCDGSGVIQCSFRNRLINRKRVSSKRFAWTLCILVTNGNVWNGMWHAAVLDMQVAGADTTERNAHNGITRTLQFGLRLVDQLELAVGYVGVG